MAASRAARNAAKTAAPSKTTKAAPAAKKATPAKKAAPAKATTARKPVNPAPVEATVGPDGAAVITDLPPVTTVEDPLFADLRKKAEALQTQHPKITMAEIAKELGVSASVAREIVEGTPKAAPKKATRAASTTGRVSGSTVQVENDSVPITCRVCNESKPARQFPTISGPGHRGTECRKCRDARREKATDARIDAVVGSRG